MSSFYQESIYSNNIDDINYYNTIDYNSFDNNIYNIDTYNSQNYDASNTNFSTNTNPYLITKKYSNKQSVPYNYNTNTPIINKTKTHFIQSKPNHDIYQITSNNEHKHYLTIETNYDNLFDNNREIQRSNTETNFHPIQRFNTSFKRPRKNYYYNLDEGSSSIEQNKVYVDQYNNINQFKNNINNNNIYNNQALKHNNLISTSKKITIEKEINKNLTSNIVGENINKNQLYQNQRYSNYNQIVNIPEEKEEFIFDNIQLIDDIKSNTNNGSFVSKNAHFTNNFQNMNDIIFIDENSKNNNYIINQINNNINNENIQYINQLNYDRQPFDNHSYVSNNSSYIIVNNTNIEKDYSNIKLPEKNSQTISPFFEINGEIISNSSNKKYFRQTTTSPVTSYGYCQNQGRRSYMEDEGKVIENLNGDPNKILFCLFDGHGGGQVSKYLQENFGNYIKKILNCGDYLKGFCDLFKIIDQDIKALNIPKVGSTATIIYIEKKDNKRILYCANVGDSRCILVKRNKIIRLSYDHRVSDPKEKQRIISGGGIIVNERVYGILMLSRSFGDFLTKDFGVIVTPHVVKYELTEDDLYCVIASDGVWDVIKEVDCLVLPKMAKIGMNTGELSRRIINEALKRKSKDNLSCFVISLN